MQKTFLKSGTYIFIKMRLIPKFQNTIFQNMNESIKIKIAVSSAIRNQLELDIDDYKLKGIGELCNLIIEYDSDLPKTSENKQFTRESNELFKNCPPLQFTLHKRNAFFEQIAQSKGAKLASLCRHYLEQYVALPRGGRELFLKKVELIKINTAIKKKKNICIAYKGRIIEIAPCFIAFSPSNVRAYLVGCRNPKEIAFIEGEKESPFKAYRICHISDVIIKEDEAFHTKSNALFRKSEDFKEHFDPFLCYGQELHIHLTEEGVKLFKTIATNRPKILKAPGESRKKKESLIETALENCTPGIYTLECSPDLAKVYFPQFLETAQVISPAGLRDYFRQRFLRAATAYGLFDPLDRKKAP